MSFKKRVGTIMAALALTLTGVVATSSPAQAAVTDCFSGRLCLWENIEYGGTLGMYSPSTSCYTMGVMNNATSAIYNRTSRTVRFYDGTGCTGSTSSIASGYRDADLRFYGTGGENWNDRITSFKLV